MAALDDDDSEDSSELQKAKPQQPDFSGDDNDDDGINDTTPNGHALQSTPTPERKARLLMRTEAVHKLVLNTPVYQGMTKSMVEPQGKFMMFVGFEEGKRETFQLKVSLPRSLSGPYLFILLCGCDTNCEVLDADRKRRPTQRVVGMVEGDR